MGCTQQLVGISAVNAYSNQIFKLSGLVADTVIYEFQIRFINKL